jgi:hypothetical protein
MSDEFDSALDAVAGAVAKILSDREVVLNRGAKDGLHIGDYVGIVDDEGSKVPDPETGEDIGELTKFKTSLRVTQVSDSLAIASTYRVRRVNRGGLGTGLRALDIGHMLKQPEWVEVPETMHVDDAEALSGESAPAVSVGDRFIEVEKDVADTGFML